MKVPKRVTIDQKVKGCDGVWGCASLKISGSKCMCGNDSGRFFLEWWEGTKKSRESVGTNPPEAFETQNLASP